MGLQPGFFWVRTTHLAPNSQKIRLESVSLLSPFLGLFPVTKKLALPRAISYTLEPGMVPRVQQEV